MRNKDQTMRSDDNVSRRIHFSGIITLCVILSLIAASALVLYDLNGDSFDFSDREMILIVTDSMDGDSDEYRIHSFPANTMVMVRHLSDEEKTDIQVGDVISFHQAGILNHHRVIDISNIDSGYVITKGDNVDGTETVYLSDVNGEVVGENHWLGVVVSFVKNYYYLVILAAVFLCISFYLIRWGFFSEPKTK